jgi:hypothetical protein
MERKKNVIRCYFWWSGDDNFFGLLGPLYEQLRREYPNSKLIIEQNENR